MSVGPLVPLITVAPVYGPPEPGAPQTAFESVSDWTVRVEVASPDWPVVSASV